MGNRTKKKYLHNFILIRDDIIIHVVKLLFISKIYDPFLGVEKVRTELFAFQVEAASAYKAVAETFTEDEKCSLSEMTVLRLGITSVTVERHSPYKELVKRR